MSSLVRRILVAAIICTAFFAAGQDAAQAAVSVNLSRLRLGSASGPEDYLYTAGNSVVATGTVDSSRYYRVVVSDPTGGVHLSSLCSPSPLNNAVTKTYTIAAADPSSAANAWKVELQEFTAATCSGSPLKSASLYFDVARTSTYGNSSLSSVQGVFGPGQTAYVTAAGVGVVQSSQANSAVSDWKTTWLKPSGVTACANTGGTDRPDSTSTGALPATAGGFLQYRPNATATGDAWNRDSNYNSSCPATTSADEGLWRLRLQRDSTHFVVLPAFTVDATPPDTSITSGPAGSSGLSTASFDFASTEAGSTFQCQLDAGAWMSCSSGQSYSALADGSHTFRVRAIDAVGNVDPTPATLTWTIDSTLPAVSLSAPADGTLTSDSTPTFSGAAGTRAGDSTTVTAKVYSRVTGSPDQLVETLTTTRSGAAWSVDASPALADGSYVVHAEQSDTGGGTGSSASATFTIDSTPPAVGLRDPVSGTATNDPTPTFGGSAGVAPGDSGTVTVKVWSGSSAAGSPAQTIAATQSGGTWSVDASSALAEGTYTVQAEQSDAAGNVGYATPHTFRVDLTPPDTVITSAPLAATADTSASFRFDSSEAGSSFQCRLDGGLWGTCASPKSYSGLADGSHTFDVRAIDAAGNGDDSPASVTWTLDTTLPSIGLDTPEDGSVTNQVTPDFAGVAGTAPGDSTSVTVKVYRQTSGSPDLLVQTLSTTRSSDGSYSVPASAALADGDYVAHAEQTDGVGNLGTSSSHAFSMDTVAPDASITSGPSATTSSTGATFRFVSSEPGSSFACRIDSGSWSRCSSPQSYSGLADGTHSFYVRATDPAGNTESVPAVRTWTVDTTLPGVTLTSPADGTITGDTTPMFAGAAGTAAGDSPSVTVKVYSTSAGSPDTLVETLAATASGSSWSVDASPPLAEGDYVVQAEQSDAASNVAVTPPVAFTIDTTPPHTSIVSGPLGPTTATSATFRFTSSEPGSTFQCRLDGGSWTPCSSPQSYSGLSADWHTFDVRAVDAAGNADPTPDSRTWLIDPTAPSLSLDAPADATFTNDVTPTFSGTASIAAGDSPSVTVEVYRPVDGAPDELVEAVSTTRSATDGSWSVPASPSLPEGSYTAYAEQDDSTGSTAYSEAVTFTVDTTAPGVHISSPPAATADATPSLSGAAGTALGDSDSVTVKVWSGSSASGAPDETLSAPRSGGSWSVDASPALADGTYTARAEQTDAAGNTGTSVARTFTVDTIAPDTTITSAPSGSTSATTASFAFSSNEAGSTFDCRLDGGAWTSCTSPKSYSGLALGLHTFDVRATDSAGNQDGTPATSSWTVLAPGGGGGSGSSGGGASGGSQPGGGASTLQLTLQRAPKQPLLKKKGKLLIFAICNQACSLSVPGVALVPGARKAAKPKAMKLGALHLNLPAGARTKLTITLGTARKAVLKALLAHRRVTVSFRAVATAGGAKAAAKLSFRLK